MTQLFQLSLSQLPRPLHQLVLRQLSSPFKEDWWGNRGRKQGPRASGLAARTMAELQVRGTSPTRDLCAPRVRDGLMDEKAVKRANRLAGVGQAVGNMDLKAVAETYKNQNGGSGIEAAAAAAAALGAALKASMTGGSVDADECLKVAQKEMQKVATRKQREAKGEAVLASRLAAVGYEGQAKSEALRLAHQQRASRLVTEKNERLAEDVATRRAMREERAAAAASRRCLSEARARFVRRWPQSEEALDSTPSSLPSLLADDPVVRRAKALCSGAAQAVAQLEEQNQLLRAKPTLQVVRSPKSLRGGLRRCPATRSSLRRQRSSWRITSQRNFGSRLPAELLRLGRLQPQRRAPGGTRHGTVLEVVEISLLSSVLDSNVPMCV
eukprot:s885_g14.t2